MRRTLAAALTIALATAGGLAFAAFWIIGLLLGYPLSAGVEEQLRAGRLNSVDALALGRTSLSGGATTTAFLVRELRYGAFRREFALPTPATRAIAIFLESPTAPVTRFVRGARGSSTARSAPTGAWARWPASRATTR